MISGTDSLHTRKLKELALNLRPAQADDHEGIKEVLIGLNGNYETLTIDTVILNIKTMQELIQIFHRNLKKIKVGTPCTERKRQERSKR